VGDWARCEREKDGGSAVINYGKPHPLLYPLSVGGCCEFWCSFAIIDSDRDLRGEVTAITDNYSPLSSPF